ncbi:ESPR domain-containing protein [Burkholderia pseudomallei]|uniref:ESPR domain-containing protein n=1 Tax=Burkholderia pseudomallei TaxID=28450 RepID=UPI000F096C2C|nr:ESPR-type extended signal peptide-containing protein [Burkholderia pseudomallei]
MNKPYRTIWNASLGAWVAASVIARTCGRPGSTRTILVVTVAMVGASGAYAQYVAGGGPQTEQPGGKRDISTSANDSALLSNARGGDSGANGSSARANGTADGNGRAYIGMSTFLGQKTMAADMQGPFHGKP